MPNHVATILTVTGKSVKDFRVKHIAVNDKSEEYFDFNTVIPCNPDLHKAISPARTEIDLERARKNGDQKQIDEVTDQMILCKLNQDKYGYTNWYDFCCAEWGTKWGAYDCYIEQDEDDVFVLRYNTAWSPASPVLQKLSEMYPDLIFEQHVLDEGMGFAGTQHWENGSYTETNHQGDFMYEFCNEVYGHNYVKCSCGEWYNVFADDGHDETLCYECNEAKDKKEKA